MKFHSGVEEGEGRTCLWHTAWRIHSLWTSRQQPLLTSPRKNGRVNTVAALLWDILYFSRSFLSTLKKLFCFKPIWTVFFTVMESNLPASSWRIHCLVNKSLPSITDPINTISICSTCLRNSKDCMWTAAIISLQNRSHFFFQSSFAPWHIN